MITNNADGQTVTVTADYLTLVHFFDTWQEQVWPDWRDSVKGRNKIAQEIQKAIPFWVGGHGAFASKGVFRSAVIIAAAKCGMEYTPLSLEQE